MDRRERRKSEQKKIKRVRSFYGKKAKISKGDITSMRENMKSKGRKMMSKKLYIFLFIIVLLLLSLTYFDYFR
mgnify:CR=1 FL=1